MNEVVYYTPVLLPLPMRQQPIADAVHGWLQEATFDEVVNLWWKAQAERADKEETHQRRLADPDDMLGKSVEYVAAYYAAPKGFPKP